MLVVVLILGNGVNQRAPNYNAATEVKVEGVVVDVQQFWCPIDGDEGTHLMLKTDARICRCTWRPVVFFAAMA